METGRTIALFGDSGAGKTTQAGALAKSLFKEKGKRTIYNAADRGGFDSIDPLIKLGVVVPTELGEGDDPWGWINAAVSVKPNPEEVGLVINDSATSMGELLLSACGNSPVQIGTAKSQRFKVPSGLMIGATNEGHYLVVQNFLLEAIWKSTWIARSGVDVLWTFALHRGEGANDSPVLGPKLAGKALTAAIPKWFRYTFRIASIPVVDTSPRHVLYLQEQSESNGAVGVSNSRYPLNAETPLPYSLEPADLVEALRLIDKGKEEALEKEREELGL